MVRAALARHSFGVAVLFAGVALISSRLARAANTSADCTSFESLVACDKAQVGQRCHGAGLCYALDCQRGDGATTIYRCDVCPTILEQPDGGCEVNLFPTYCNDAGATCRGIPPYCTGGGSLIQYLCAAPVAETPTGPPARTGGGCSCEVGSESPAGRYSVLSPLLVIFLVSRRRGNRPARV